MTEGISNSQIGRIAQGLAVSRTVFAKAYDPSALGNGGLDFKTIAELENQRTALAAGRAKDQRDFAAAMRAANDAGWLVEFVFENFSDLATDSSTAAHPELQSIAHRTQRFQDARTITSGTLAAMRRCCQILSTRTTPDGMPEQTALGSGFLIGPHLVLTNHHVIAPLRNDPALRPAVRFDYHAGDQSVVRQRIYQVPSGTDDSWLVDFADHLDGATTAAELTDHLDYAILRLDGRPGDERGYYRLNNVPELPDFGTPVQVWQFPRGQPMKVVTNNRMPPADALGFDPANGAAHTRIYYVANAEKGSSGGLVLRDNTEPVAIHDAGFSHGAPDDQKLNRGIPLRLIAARAGPKIDDELRRLAPMVGWHTRRQLPVLGRKELQERIFDAAFGDGRIIMVLTEPDGQDRRAKIGRSYTREILEASLPANEHHVLVFEASQIDPDPFLTANRIVSSIAHASAADLPAPTGETTLDADATGVLVERTVSALKDAVPGKTLWLMIDDIDADPIGTQWGSSSYLIALYRRIVDEPRLRVVLTGLPRRLEGLEDLRVTHPNALLEEELRAPPDHEDLRAWVAGHLTGQIGPEEFAPRLSSLLASVAMRDSGAGGPEAAAASLNDLLADHARDAFRREPGHG